MAFNEPQRGRQIGMADKIDRLAARQIDGNKAWQAEKHKGGNRTRQTERETGGDWVWQTENQREGTTRHGRQSADRTWHCSLLRRDRKVEGLSFNRKEALVSAMTPR